MRQQGSSTPGSHHLLTLLLALVLGSPLAAQSGEIAGTVTDDLLAGAGGLTVQLEDPDGGFLDATTTAAGSGSYAFTGLADGDYLVRVLSDPVDLDLVGEYYDDVNEYDRDLATVLTVAGGAAITHVDFVLAAGGSIAGTLAGLSPGESVRVQSVDALSGRYRGDAGSDPATFAYRVDSQRAGSYKLFVEPSGTDRAFQWWDGQTTFNRAGDVALAADQDLAGKDFTLGPGTSISGTVTLDPDPGDGGATLQQLSISLFQADTYEYLWGTGVASDGTYSLANLPPGSYLVQAEGHGSGYMRELWTPSATVPGEPPVADYGQATAIAVDAGSPAAGIDFLLEEGRRLSGHVFLESVAENGVQDPGEPDLGDVWVNAYQIDGPYGNGTSSDGTGDFEIVGLPPGEYGVEVRSSSVDLPFVPEKWNDRALWQDDDPVDLTLADAAGVDFGVATERVISGKVFLDLNDDQVQQPGEPPLDSVSVQVYEIGTERYAGEAARAGDGRWSLGVRAGTYRVEAYTHSPSLIREYWNNAFFHVDAEAVDVTAADAADIDFGIVTGDTYGTLRGRLVEAGTSLGIPGVEVYVSHQQTGESHWGATTDAVGAFVVANLPPGSFTVTFETETTNAAHGTDYVATLWSSSGLSNDPDPANQRLDYPAVPGDGTDLGDVELAVGGSISGRVTRAADGSPVSGYQVNGGLRNDPLGRGFGMGAQTDAAGDYVLRGLLPGDYDVRTDGGVPGLADQRHPGTVAVASGAAVTGIDFALEEGTSISGTVSLSPDPVDGGATLERIWMDVIDAVTGEGLSSRPVASDGTYSFDNLAPGSYLVQASSWNTPYVYELWTPQAAVPGAPPVFDNNQATPIAVDVGSPATGIDFLLDEGRRITGHVFLDSLVANGVQDPGEPDVAGANVNAGLFDGGFGQGAATDESGDFTLQGLPPGEYRVTVESSDVAQPFVAEQWNDRSLYQSADPVDVTATDATGIDFAVVRGRVISGQVFLDLDDDQVRDAGEPPFTQLALQVYDFATGEHVGNGVLGADGAYAVGMPAGVYRVAAWPYQETVLGEYWEDASYHGDADPVDVTAADASGIDFGLVAAGFYGTLRGQVTDGVGVPGDGVPGVEVQVLRCENDEHLTSVFTGADGSFTVPDLAPGSYKLYFETRQTNAANDTDYVATYWSVTGEPGVIDPNLLRIDFPTLPDPPGGPGTEIDPFPLPHGGSISGQVFPPAGDSLPAGLTVSAQSFESGGGNLPSAAVDGSGLYHLRGLPAPATYRVQADTGGTDFVQAYYLTAAESTFDHNTAAAVEVEPGLDTGNIDLHLERGGSISGTVTGEGAPLAGVQISAGLGDDPLGRNYGGGASSDENGDYTIGGLPAGDYEVRVDQRGSDWANETYPDLVAVSPPGDTPGIDFDLEPAGRIRGRITQDGGLPVVNLRVEATDFASGQFVSDGHSDENGDYTISDLPQGRDYRLQAATWEGQDPQFQNFIVEFWDDQRRWDLADPVSVPTGPGAEVTGIDFALDLGGAISGLVTAEVGGAPIQSVWISADDWLGRGIGNGDNTDHNGFYIVRGLPEGDYRVQAQPWPLDYVGEHFDDVRDWNDATAVHVAAVPAGGEIPITEHIDFALAPAYRVSGTVTGSGGAPIAGIRVSVSRHDYWDQATTLADGTWELRGVPAGSFVAATETGGTAWIRQQQAIEVAADLTGVDFALELGATVRGRVFEDDGDGLYQPGEGRADVQVAALDWETGEWLASGESDADGLYEIRGLAAGSSWIELQPDSRNYVRMYWDNVFAQHDASPVEIVDDGGLQDVSGIDFRVVQGQEIRGTVFYDADGDGLQGTGEPALDNVGVSAEDPEGNISSNWSWNEPDGSYVIHGVFPGQYQVLAHAQGTPYASEFYRLGGGTYHRSEADLVDTSSGDASGIDLSLELGGGVRGTIVDGTTSDPLPGIQVNANAFDGDGWWSGDTTDQDGNYHMTGLPPGDYRVDTWDPGEVYLGETWDDTVFWDDADPVHVVARTSPTDLLATVADFDLERGGAIEGRVYDDIDEDGTFSAGDAPLAGIWVQVDEHAQPHRGLGGAATEADGTYRAVGLPPGLDLRVSVHPYPADYVGGFWDGDDSPDWDENAAQAMTVDAGNPTTGVDFGLLASGAIAGTVVDGNGQALAGMWVNANNPATGEWFGDSTNETGTYTIHAVPAGTYRVTAGDDQPYRWEVWNNRTDWNAYTPVSVTARNVTPGIDFVLPRMPRITSGPTPASGVRGATVEGVTVLAEELFATPCGTPPCVDLEIGGGGVTVENLALDGGSGTFTFDVAVAADATLGEHGLAVVNRGLVEDGAAFELRAFEVGFAVGDEPAASPERLYMTDSGMSQLRVYGTTDMALLGTVDLCCNPAAVALTPDGRFAFTNGGDRRISVVDTRIGDAGAEVARLELDGAFGFQGLDATADRLYALDRSGENRVVAYDTATWLEVGELALGAAPYNLLLNPAGDTLYVLHRSPWSLTVIDPAGLTEVSAVALPDQPRGLAVTPDGSRIFVGGRLQLIVVDAALALSDPANAVVATFDLRTNGVLDVAAHAASGKVLAYVRNGNQVTVIDASPALPQPEVLRSFEAGYNPNALLATADRLVLAYAWGSMDFYAVDAATVLDSAPSIVRFENPEGVAFHDGGLAVGPTPGLPDPAAPAITGVSGPATNGAPFSVVLTGSNLGADVEVWLQGTRHRGTVIAADAGSMTVEFPAATPAGSHRVVASRPGAGGPLSGVSPLPLVVEPASVYAPNQEVYLTSYGSDRLTIYETGGGRDAIQIQHYGVGIAVTPDGTRGVAVQLDNGPQQSGGELPASYIDATVVDLDPDSATYRQVVATVPWLWSSFSKPVVTPDLGNPNGIFVYTPNTYLSDTVSVIDPWAGAEVDLDGDPATQSIPLDDPYTWIYGTMLPGINRIELDGMVTDDNLGPFDVALTPAGNLLYVTNLTASTVMIVDAVSHEVRAELDWYGQLGWVREVDIPPTGDFVYVTGGDAGGQPSLFVMLPGVYDDTAFVDQIPLDESASGIAVSADGTTAYLTARFLGELWAVDVRPASRGAIETIPLAVGILGVAEAAADQLLYVANLYAQEVYVVDLHQSRRHQWITTLGAEPCPEHLAFRPAVATDWPLVVAVSPASGAPDGGDPVTLIGAHFDPGAGVTFGGVDATGVAVVSSTRITAVTPPGALGAVDVTVTNPDDHNGTLDGGFTYADDVTAPAFTTLPWVASEVLNGQTVTLEVRWKTGEPADSTVDVRPVGAPTYDRVTDPALVKDHAMVLAGLLAGTDYELVVASADRHGNAASRPLNHTTLTAPDVTPPAITSGPTAVATTTTTATVEWMTHELATSVVQWDPGANGSFNRTTTGADASAHSVTLTGLTPATLHQARVLSVDASGNGPTISAPITFSTAALPDDVPPVIVDGPEVAYLSNDLVIVLWETDEPATSFVRYGVSSVQEEGVIDVDLVTRHVVFLTDLLAGTTYGYQAGSTDASGNTVVTPDPFKSLLKSFGGFTTPTEADTAAPGFSPPEIVLLAADRVLIRVAATEPVRLQAFYGGTSAVAPGFDAAPSLVLAGLEPDTLYTLRLVLTDPAGNATPIEGLGFHTPAVADTTAPAISALAAGPLTATTARITWATDEPADAVVVWGSSQVGRSTLATGHSLLLTGLQPATAYSFEVTSRDASGNAAAAGGSFTTANPAPSISSVAPTRATQGTTVEVAIYGRNLAGSGLDAGPGIDLGGLAVNATGTRVAATLTVAPTAAVGPRPLTVTTAGGSAAATFTVVDTTIPVVTIDQPANGAELPSPTVTVRGTVSEPVESVTVNGVAATVAGLTYEAEITLPAGDILARRIVVQAADASGNQGTVIIFVSLADAGPPELSLAATPSVLWPANHKMVPVTVTVEVSDDSDPDPAVTLVAATSSEPDDAPGSGDGHTVDDIQGADLGTDDRQVLLRAERAGDGPGRVYTLTYRATDQAGYWVEESVEVVVPHDQGG